MAARLTPVIALNILTFVGMGNLPESSGPCACKIQQPSNHEKISVDKTSKTETNRLKYFNRTVTTQ